VSRNSIHLSVVVKLQKQGWKGFCVIAPAQCEGGKTSVGWRTLTGKEEYGWRGNRHPASSSAPREPPFYAVDVLWDERDGEALFRLACEHDVEGIVAKWKFSPYLRDAESTG